MELAMKHLSYIYRYASFAGIVGIVLVCPKARYQSVELPCMQLRGFV